MNADLTFNSVVFKRSYDNKDESLRQSNARAVNTPDRMFVRSQDYLPSSTKVPGRRYSTKIERHDIDANLQKIISSANFSVEVPSTVTQAQLDVLVATFKAVVADASFMTAVLNEEK